jgi:hypothetical protein
VIGFAGEQRAGFLLADVLFGGGELPIEIFQKVLALLGVGLFFRKADVRFHVAGKSGQLGVGADLLFGALAVAQYCLRRFLIVPEVRLGDTRFQRFQDLAVLRSVKENSGPARCEV